MKEKIVEKVINQTIFIAYDGTEFDDENECRKYELTYAAGSRFGYDVLNDIKLEDDAYVLIQNREDYVTIVQYIYDVCGYPVYDTEPDCNDYPCVMNYQSDGTFKVVYDYEYLEAKTICEKYEKMLELRDKSDNKAREEKQYATVRWAPEDIMDDDEDSLTYDEAAKWWEENEGWFREVLIGMGNEALTTIDWDDEKRKLRKT